MEWDMIAYVTYEMYNTSITGSALNETSNDYKAFSNGMRAFYF
jgi:hypothetical protein